MGKFGKKVVVDRAMNNYMIGIMAPSGWGKSTLMYNVCDKKFGDDGYLLLDMGAEDGTKAISGVVAEKIPTWKKMKEVIDDIVKNKENDYTALKVVILDTIDATFEIAEQYVVTSFNNEHMGEQGFKKCTSINSCEGGFGRGMDRCIETVKKEIKRLNDVGVGVWWTSHVKERDQTDLFTGTAYTQLTASMTMKYFNSIKDISHVIGFGYYNRQIEKQEVGEANPITKKKKVRKATVAEDRMIKFRDDSMVADAKSRFANIVDEIPLDADEFIDAITNAIDSASGNVSVAKKVVKKVEPAPDPEPVEDVEDDLDEEVKETPVEEAESETEDLFDDDENDNPPFDEDKETFDEDEAKERIRMLFKEADKTTKDTVKSIRGSKKLNEIHDKGTLMSILEALA